MVEEPLEIQIATPSVAAAPVVVTMRTPGNDEELALGLLVSEGHVHRRDDVAAVARVGENQVLVHLADGVAYTPPTSRPWVASSACGVCGKSALEAVWARGLPMLGAGPRVEAALVATLPRRMREDQPTFDSTGGLHAAALFTSEGRLERLFEDVGRHNAVDKVVGALCLADQLPARERLLVVSGRVGFEIVQKAIRAGIPILAAVGAPTSLALRLAASCGLTVAGFVRDGRLNVYTGPDRIA